VCGIVCVGVLQCLCGVCVWYSLCGCAAVPVWCVCVVCVCVCGIVCMWCVCVWV